MNYYENQIFKLNKLIICSKRIIFIRGFLILIHLICITGIKGYAQKPIIIEFGWDYPDVNQLYKRLDSMQKTPFDGICFSFQNRIMEAFETELKRDNFFELDKISKLKWGKYTNNFIILRGFSKMGGHWFNDNAWDSIAKNINGLSKAIKIGKLKGVLFDPEYYYENQVYNPWTYSKSQYPNLTFEEVQNQVKHRGIQFITALQKQTNNFSFLSIWLTSLIIEDEKIAPLNETRHALLLPFIEGILLGKHKNVKIIDGNEYAYWNIKPSQFIESKTRLNCKTEDLMKSHTAKNIAKDIQISQPIFYDGLLERHPSFNKGVPSIKRWNWLEENLKHAIANSNSNIVWFYNERLNWWTGPVNDTLVNIVQNCKTTFLPNIQNDSLTSKKMQKLNCNNINSNLGFYYSINPKSPMQCGDTSFTFNLEKKLTLLKIKFLNQIPSTLDLYVNNCFVVKIKPKKFYSEIKIKKGLKGRLAILAKYESDLESCGYLDF